MITLNAAQIHLALTHLPVVLSVFGFILLALSFIRKNRNLDQIAYWTFVIAGVICIPVFLTGEGTEEIVEHLAGISEHQIEAHEEMAKVSLIVCSTLGILSLIAAFIKGKISNWFRWLILSIALLASGMMLQTAHQGGLIRHQEELQGKDSTTFNERKEPGHEKDDD